MGTENKTDDKKKVMIAVEKDSEQNMQEKTDVLNPAEKDKKDNSKEYISTARPELERDETNIISLVKLIAPGTKLREAIDDIVRSRNGALIVRDAPNLMRIVEGGFKVNCRFTPQRIVELCKMDGAVILSHNMDRIIYANTLLAPDIIISTQETGTRHKAAQRTAKQLKTLVIAVSERRKTVTLYDGNLRYVLSGSAEILRKAMESLQILEKQCEIFEDLIINLNIFEFTDSAKLNDISEIIQRGEIIQKITSIINRDIAELGKQGILIRMRLRQLIKNIEREESLIIRDYSKLKFKKIQALLSILSFEELLDIKNFYTALGYKEDSTVESRGHRILNKLGLEEKIIQKIMKNYSSLNKLLESTLQDLTKALKNEGRAKKIKKDLSEMKEQVLLEKKI